MELNLAQARHLNALSSAHAWKPDYFHNFGGLCSPLSIFVLRCQPNSFTNASRVLDRMPPSQETTE